MAHLGGGEELVEDMVVALPFALHRDPGQLEKVVLDVAAADLQMAVEAHLHELAETRRIVVAHRLRIAYNKQVDGNFFQNPLFNLSN